MILIDAGPNDAAALDEMLIVADQLRQLGYRVVIDEQVSAGQLTRSQKYLAVRYLADIVQAEVTHVLILCAQTLSDETLSRLHSYDLDADVPVTAVGEFADRQSMLHAQSKLSFALAREVAVHSQAAGLAAAPLGPQAPSQVLSPDGLPRILAYLSDEAFEMSATLQSLLATDAEGVSKTTLLVSPEKRAHLRDLGFSTLPYVTLQDLPVATLAHDADILILLGAVAEQPSVVALTRQMLANGKVVVDCTPPDENAQETAPLLRGPTVPEALPLYLRRTVLPNLAEIKRITASSAWNRSSVWHAVMKAIGPPPPKTPGRPKPDVWFLPTNGVGLGHAQRSSLIAQNVAQAASVVFAAFPSCVPMLQKRGFPCLPLVPKSPDHTESFANDLLNYHRLGRSVKAGDTFVFDGGHIFDSVYRLLSETDLRAVWVRRGLWKAGVSKANLTERAYIFDRIIVPGEAFDELNGPMAYAPRTHMVGPIVQAPGVFKESPAEIREKLKAIFAQDFDQLVVTMLGAGVAADRSAHMQMLCHLFEKRPNCLQLIIQWPGAKVPQGLYGWKNSRVVQTQNALNLCRAADFVLSAVGYNSFHEILYHQIPAILMPQVATFMDDQTRRARAASDRGLAETVMAEEVLRLQREVTEFLDGGKAERLRSALGKLTLPAIGTTAAAALINEGWEA